MCCLLVNVPLFMCKMVSPTQCACDGDLGGDGESALLTCSHLSGLSNLCLLLNIIFVYFILFIFHCYYYIVPCY